MAAPIVSVVNQAKAEFLKEYGFPAEKLHASTVFESALTRWFSKQLDLKSANKPRQVEISGLEVVRMTKQSAKFEFYLSASRGDLVYSSHVEVEPEAAGFRKAVNSNEIVISTDEDGAVIDENEPADN